VQEARVVNLLAQVFDLFFLEHFVVVDQGCVEELQAVAEGHRGQLR